MDNDYTRVSSHARLAGGPLAPHLLSTLLRDLVGPLRAGVCVIRSRCYG